MMLPTQAYAWHLKKEKYPTIGFLRSFFYVRLIRMEEITSDPQRPQTIEKAVEESRAILVRGGVVMLPTDTIYGLCANALDEEAIDKVYRIKGRDTSKPLSLLARDLPMARRLACIDSRTQVLLERLWPGPVTVILRKKDMVPHALTGGGETVAIRVPDDPLLDGLLSRIDFPITATSANLAGEPNLLKAFELRKRFAEADSAPDLFVDGGDLSGRAPSTIIDLTDPVRPKLVRLATGNQEHLQELLRSLGDR